MTYLRQLPEPPRQLVYLLFLTIEWLAPFLLAGVGRFSNRSLALRERAIGRWSRSRFFLYGVISEGLKAQLTMTYMSHPLVQQHMGVWKTCARDQDPYNTPVRTDVFSATTPNGLKEDVR